MRENIFQNSQNSSIRVRSRFLIMGKKRLCFEGTCAGSRRLRPERLVASEFKFKNFNENKENNEKLGVNKKIVNTFKFNSKKSHGMR